MKAEAEYFEAATQIAYEIGLNPGDDPGSGFQAIEPGWDERLTTPEEALAYVEPRGDAFWQMTPADFDLAVQAYRNRQEDEWYRTAWMVAYLLKPHTKKKITPEKLLGRKPRRQSGVTTPQKKAAE